ncbi:hypothetical protein AWJ19_26975 [Paenibacillus sp. DMB5]|nr:hypothetical protein AWJ19_26975 [Paenibacillus sp. DMB5]
MNGAWGARRGSVHAERCMEGAVYGARGLGGLPGRPGRGPLEGFFPLLAAGSAPHQLMARSKIPHFIRGHKIKDPKRVLYTFTGRCR